MRHGKLLDSWKKSSCAKAKQDAKQIVLSVLSDGKWYWRDHLALIIQRRMDPTDIVRFYINRCHERMSERSRAAWSIQFDSGSILLVSQVIHDLLKHKTKHVERRLSGKNGQNYEIRLLSKTSQEKS